MSIPTSEDLAVIRARAEAATEGPWLAYSARPMRDEPQEHGVEVARYVDTADERAVFEDRYCRAPDRAFIAAARTDVPVLLDAVEALTARIDKALALHVPSPLWHDECADCFEDLPCSTVRALTEETPHV